MTTRSKTSILFAAIISAATLGFAQETPAPPPAPTPAPAPAAPAADADRGALEKFSRDFDLLPGLGRPNSDPSDQPPVDLGPDPLGDLTNTMTGVHADLSQYKTDPPVQAKEKEVVDTLDKLIAALTPKGGGAGNGNTPNGGRKRSGIFQGDPKFGDLHGVENQGRQWAQLPPKERERILQSRTEGFPPGFESLLQSYYQRLAEEKTPDEKPDVPATQPGTH